MRYEIDVYGVLMPAMLLWILVAYALSALLRLMLHKASVYRLVWHPALFDFALFICLLGGVIYLASEYLS